MPILDYGRSKQQRSVRAIVLAAIFIALIAVFMYQTG